MGTIALAQLMMPLFKRVPHFPVAPASRTAAWQKSHVWCTRWTTRLGSKKMGLEVAVAQEGEMVNGVELAMGEGVLMSPMGLTVVPGEHLCSFTGDRLCSVVLT